MSARNHISRWQNEKWDNVYKKYAFIVKSLKEGGKIKLDQEQSRDYSYRLKQNHAYNEHPWKENW